MVTVVVTLNSVLLTLQSSGLEFPGASSVGSEMGLV